MVGQTNVRRVEIAESNNGANFGNYIRWKLNGNFRKLISAPCAWKIQSQSRPPRVVINDKFVTLPVRGRCVNIITATSSLVRKHKDTETGYLDQGEWCRG